MIKSDIKIRIKKISTGKYSLKISIFSSCLLIKLKSKTNVIPTILRLTEKFPNIREIGINASNRINKFKLLSKVKILLNLLTIINS